jgi:dipeptidyl aminopeptidase/acylaminoacyl peptidase
MFRSNTLRAAAVPALLAAALAPASAQSSDPAKLFARDYEFVDPTLSPTGEYVAVDAPDGVRRSISMISLKGDGARNVFRLAGGTDIWGNFVLKEPAAMVWSDDNRLVVFEGYDYGRFGEKFYSGNVYVTNSDATGQEQLFGYNLDSSNFRAKFKDDGVARLVDLLPGEKGKALFYYLPGEKVDGEYATDIFIVDTLKATRERVERFTGRQNVFADNSGKVRLLWRYEDDHKLVAKYRPTPESEFKPLPASMAGQSINLWFFDSDNNHAYATVSDKGEPGQLYRIDFAAGTRERVGGQPGQEISDFERAGRAGPPVVLRYAAGKPKIDYLDPKSPWAQLHAGLMKAFPGNMVNFIDLTRDENTLLFATWSDRDPGAYYLFDRKANKPSLLFRAAEWIDPAQMSPTLPLEFKNRNGDTLYGFLTMAHGRSANMPLVVMPHGGPYDVSDSWGFDRDAQFLASLGYAVLQVNYRGSGMRGKEFERSGYKMWGTGIQDDIADGVRHVIGQGLVNKDKVCIYGISFGGYSAMMNPIRNPGMYKCAIGYAGVYDLKKMVADDSDSAGLRAFWARTLGDEAAQAAQSPTAQAAKLDVPMLLIHGRADKTAPIAQYELAAAALKAAGKPFESLVKADEGHGFYKAADQEEAYNRMKAFLLKYNPPN